MRANDIGRRWHGAPGARQIGRALLWPHSGRRRAQQVSARPDGAELAQLFIVVIILRAAPVFARPDHCPAPDRPATGARDQSFIIINIITPGRCQQIGGRLPLALPGRRHKLKLQIKIKTPIGARIKSPGGAHFCLPLSTWRCIIGNLFGAIASARPKWL